MDEQRWRFCQDNDSHWYLIIAEDYKIFCELLEQGQKEDDYGKFLTMFDIYMTGSGPEVYSFTAPERDF